MRPISLGARLILREAGGEALDAVARVFEQFRLRRIGNAEVGAEAEGRAVHHGHALLMQELGDELFVGRQHLAALGLFAHRL